MGSLDRQHGELQGGAFANCGAASGGERTVRLSVDGGMIVLLGGRSSKWTGKRPTGRAWGRLSGSDDGGWRAFGLAAPRRHSSACVCCRRCRDVLSAPSIPTPSSKSQTNIATGRAIPTSRCPQLDWWRSFRSSRAHEPDGARADRKPGHRRRGRPDHSGRRAIAPFRLCAAANHRCRCSQERTRTLPATTKPAGRDRGGPWFSPGKPAGELHASISGVRTAPTLLASEQTAIASRFDRDIIALTAEVGRRQQLISRCSARRIGCGSPATICQGSVQRPAGDPRPFRPEPPRSSRSPSRKACSTR